MAGTRTGKQRRAVGGGSKKRAGQAGSPSINRDGERTSVFGGRYAKAEMRGGAWKRDKAEAVEQEGRRRLARTRSVAWSSSHHLSFSDQPVLNLDTHEFPTMLQLQRLTS